MHALFKGFIAVSFDPFTNIHWMYFTNITWEINSDPHKKYLLRFFKGSRHWCTKLLVCSVNSLSSSFIPPQGKSLDSDKMAERALIQGSQKVLWFIIHQKEDIPIFAQHLKKISNILAKIL